MRYLLLALVVIGMCSCAPRGSKSPASPTDSEPLQPLRKTLSARGLLGTSKVVQGKYTLVFTQTGRTIAYLEPANAQVHLEAWLDKDVQVEGMGMQTQGGDVLMIKVEKVVPAQAPGH